jgi:hypothetical protein
LGTIANLEQETSDALNEPYQEAQQAVQTAAVKNTDETETVATLQSVLTARRPILPPILEGSDVFATPFLSGAASRAQDSRVARIICWNSGIPKRRTL